jgi:hypothetical protein
MRFDSFFGIDMTQTAVITNKLKADAPTMVPGPKSPAVKLKNLAFFRFTLIIPNN